MIEARRADGFPDVALTAEVVSLAGGRRAYLRVVNHHEQLTCIEGDRAVIVSTSMPRVELIQIAESVY